MVTKNKIYKVEGIIIKKVDSGEVDRLFNVYTKEYGKLQFKARSVRKNESKLKGYLDMFNHARFLIAKSKTIDIITDVESIDCFLNTRAGLTLMQRAFYMANLCDKLIAGQEKDEDLWNFILESFQQLNQGIIASDFEEKFLEILGYGNLKDRNNQRAIDFIGELLNLPKI